MFEHHVLISQRESEERCWQIAAASHPHLSKRDQQERWTAAQRIGQVGTIRKSAVDMVQDDETRIQVIGSHLKLHGERWAMRHRRHIEWLESIGVTREEAIARHEQWLADTMADPFWKR